MDAPQPREPEVQSGSAVVPQQRRPGARPPDRPPTSAPTSASSTPPQPSPDRRGRLRRVLLVTLLAVGVGVVGAVGYGFIWYDQATKPDRSAPDVVVDNYLSALLKERDTTRAELFTCDQAAVGEVLALRQELERRERDFGVTVRTSWGALARERVDDRRENVTVDVTVTGISGGEVRSERTETWSFKTAMEDGWRVCAATRVP